MVTTQELLDKGVMIDEKLLKAGISEQYLAVALELFGEDLFIIDDEIIDKVKAHLEQKKLSQKKEGPREGTVEVVWSYDQPSHKRTYDDFVKALKMRFKNIEGILKGRRELQMTTSIARIRAKQERESVAFIAMVKDKQMTANGNIILSLEDMSGEIKALIGEKKKDLFELAKDIQLDEVIGISAVGSGEIVFVDNILLPDVPLTKELKKGPIDDHIAFVGDPHFGSRVFMEKDFKKMLLWLQGKVGNDEQKEIASKVKYVFFAGDLVEGVGIYPGQEEDLAIKDIRDQYVLCAEYLKQIPSHMHIILFTGNHDAGRLAEPQGPLMEEYAAPLFDLPNVTIVSNPAMVNVGATKTFPGFDCLLYHGGSFIYYSDQVPSIRTSGGQKRVDLIMKFLLQRRHLAPTHNAALTVPTTDRDWLFIDRVPDIFITGHIHRVSAANYRNVTMVNCGCWTETTEDQVKRGLEPQPGKLLLMNLRSRAVKVINFKKEDNKPVSRSSDKK